jgi:hypothetical protein
MSKILITGMSAPHVSADANKRTLSFASLLIHVLTQQGHNVVQSDPEMSWTLDDLKGYDKILVGLSPITSLSANRTYGALKVINLLRGDSRLSFYIDAPEPTRIMSSLRAIKKKPDNLVKSFYSYRKGYTQANTPDVLKSLLETVDMLLEDEWPTTVYPTLPWTAHESVAEQLSESAQKNLKPVNLDRYVVAEQRTPDVERTEKWVVENFSTPWTKSTIATLASPTVPMKWHKGWTDDQVADQISRGIGALISPHQNGTWWTYRIVQCLNALTPVATDWRESGFIGSPWMQLASAIEHMSQEERTQLAKDQRDAYLEAIPTKRDAAIILTESLELYSRKV